MSMNLLSNSIIGMDFGTTNTGAGFYDGNRIHLLALDPQSPTPEICRSAVYMTRTGDYYLGSSALRLYFEQNIGRPTRYRKIRVGEIMQVFADLPVYYRDVYVFEDEFSPGRLFTSIKTALHSRDYYGTIFRGFWYSASDLVAIFLMGIKTQMEAQTRSTPSEVVLGRPVYFSNDPSEDRIAQSRLLDAAFKAGFSKVYLEYEPVAAALAYEYNLSQGETILVFDFGGGTLDFTIMQVGIPGGREVLATGGVSIAGDIFDQRLFRATIPKHLGEDDEFISNGVRLPIPAHIFDTLAHPHEILSLNTPQILEMLNRIHAGSIHPDKTHALIKVISSNYALAIFDLVEQTKRELSEKMESDITVSTPEFWIHERVSRGNFERAISRETEAIQVELLATLKQAGLKPEQIDRVIRTGGSSQIPLFVSLLNKIFGPEKVHAMDTFSSVASGLAIRGYQIASGFEEIPYYTADSAGRSQENPVGKGEESAPKPVDLVSVKKRLQVRLGYHQDRLHLPEYALLIINQAGIFELPLHGLDTRLVKQAVDELTDTVIWSDISLGTQFLLARIEEDVLIATNQAKLISSPVRDLVISQQASLDGIIQSLPLDSDESVTAITSWNQQASEADLICMLTSSGQGRVFDLSLLADYIARRPYFQLERRYTGIPLALFPAYSDELILVGTNRGRIGQAPINAMIDKPHELIRLQRGESISAWASVELDAPLAALSNDGRCLGLNLQNFLRGGSPASRQGALRSNFAIIGFLASQDRLNNIIFGLSSRGCLYKLPEVNFSETKSRQGAPRKMVELDPKETLIACLRLGGTQGYPI